MVLRSIREENDLSQKMLFYGSGELLEVSDAFHYGSVSSINFISEDSFKDKDANKLLST